MARKRFITSDMSSDERIALVAAENPVAGLMWPWFIIGFDDWGRMTASPIKIKLSIFQAFPYTVQVIREAIELYVKHGLVHFYEVGGNQYLAIEPEKFYRYQPYIRQVKREKDMSPIPAPPNPPWGENNRGDDNCAQVRDDARICIPSPSPSPSPISNSLDTDPDNSSWYSVSSRGVQGGSPTTPTTVFMFEREFGRPLSPMEIEQITVMENEAATEIVAEALRRSVARGKLNLRYIQTILNDWRKKNLRTLREVLDYEAAFEEKRLQGKMAVKPPAEKVAEQVQHDKKRFEEQVNAAIFGIRFEIDGLADKSPENIRTVINLPKFNYDPAVKREALKRLNLTAYTGGD